MFQEISSFTCFPCLCISLFFPGSVSSLGLFVCFFFLGALLFCRCLFLYTHVFALCTFFFSFLCHAPTFMCQSV